MGVGLRVMEGLGESLGVRLSDTEAVALQVGLKEYVGLELVVGDQLRVGVSVAVSVHVFVELGVAVNVWVQLGVWVAESLGVWLLVEVED